jgi:purine-nucleoside phosphorylase
MNEHAVRRRAIAEAAEAIRPHLWGVPRIALILGSGLNVLADRATDAWALPYAEIPHFPHSTVPGHAGRLISGRLAGVDVLIMQGRVHFYEGYSPAEATFPIRVLQALGVRILCVTNAAGGLNPTFAAGDPMAITDQINLVGMAGHHPLRGPNDDSLGTRFPSMVRAYDPALIAALRQVAQERGLTLRSGVYAMVAGPTFETPAEVRMLRAWGADAIGMSTAPEVAVARHAGMRVLGLSLITNVAIDTQEEPSEPTHAEVVEVGQRAVPVLAALIEGVLPRLHAALTAEQG